MKYRTGESGNPAGRPKGIPDKRSTLRALLEPHAQELVGKVVELAKAGDTAALRMCIDRLIPPIKAKDTAANIRSLEGTLTDQARTILAALTGGDLTPDEASTLMQTVAAQARLIEVDELERRVAALEALNN